MTEQRIGESGELLSNDIEQIEEPGIPEEFDGYIEKVEKVSELSVPLQNSMLVQQGDTFVAPVPAQAVVPDDAVILPLTQDSFEHGLQEQMVSSARWAAEWSVMMIKKYGNKVFFKG